MTSYPRCIVCGDHNAPIRANHPEDYASDGAHIGASWCRDHRPRHVPTTEIVVGQSGEYVVEYDAQERCTRDDRPWQLRV